MKEEIIDVEANSKNGKVHFTILDNYLFDFKSSKYKVIFGKGKVLVPSELICLIKKQGCTTYETTNALCVEIIDTDAIDIIIKRVRDLIKQKI